MTVAGTIASSLSASIPKMIARVAQPLVDRTRPGCPGKVLSYDPRLRRATVQVQGQLIVGDEALDIETAESVPVRFIGGGGFFIVHDVKTDDAGWISFSHFPLDAWKADGSVAQVRAGRYALQDAQFEPLLTSFGHPGVDCPRGCMIIGAENGPRITWDINRVSLELTALTELVLAAGVRIILRAADIIIDGALRT